MKKLEIIINLLFRGNRYLKSKDGRYQLYKWSKAVRTKQPYCDICGSKDNLQAHHLLDKSSVPFLALYRANGVTLCSTHHRDFHTNYLPSFSIPCTPLDYIKYREQVIKTKRINLFLVLTTILIIKKRGK